MIYKSTDGKSIEVMRLNYKDDKSYYLAILKAKGLTNSGSTNTCSTNTCSTNQTMNK
jgi:hypothetical protein